jgi:hypothetical protein
MNKEKLTLSELDDLLEYTKRYFPFQNELALKDKMTIKQIIIIQTVKRKQT